MAAPTLTCKTLKTTECTHLGNVINLRQSIGRLSPLCSAQHVETRLPCLYGVMVKIAAIMKHYLLEKKIGSPKRYCLKLMTLLI